MANDESARHSETILLVDDDPEILGMLNIRLDKFGYQVLTASNGDAALEKARAHKPDLVVLDVMMPRRNGWEVARALKQDPETQHIKIIMLTAIGAQVNEMTSPLYGVDAHIDKPFQFPELDQKIEELLASS